MKWWATFALWIALLLLSSCKGDDMGNNNNTHIYSYYPCLPREPPRILTPSLFVPPSGPTFVERKFEAVAERTFMFWVYMMRSKSKDKERLLFLFNRSWGALSNGTMMRVVWKDASDIKHPDREVNITHIDLLEQWQHITFRFWEKEAQIAVNGNTIFRIFDCKPWVDFTGFFLGHTATVANPNPVETMSFFFDCTYLNYICGDDEMMQHMQRGRDALISKLYPIESERVWVRKDILQNFFSQVDGPVSWTQWPVNETATHDIVQMWNELGSDLKTPEPVALNVSHFLYYPCLPRKENVSMTPYKLHPLSQGHVRFERDKMPPLIAEYSIAFHMLYRKRVGNSDWAMIFLFDCSWGMFTNGKALKVVWEDSILQPVDRVLELDNIATEDTWTHIAVRMWEKEMHVLINGRFVQRIFASPNVENCGFVLGSTQTVAQKDPPSFRGIFYLFSYWNHIISDFELDSHLQSMPPFVRPSLKLEDLVPADTLTDGKQWMKWLTNVGITVAAIAVISGAVWALNQYRDRRRRLDNSTSGAPRKKCNGPCGSLLLLHEFSGRNAQLCKSCELRNAEKDKQAEAEALIRKQKKEEKRRVEDLQRKLDSEITEKRSLESHLERARAEVTSLRKTQAECNRQISALREQCQEFKEQLKDHMERLQKATQEKGNSERDAGAWRGFADEMKRKEQVAKENLHAQMRHLQDVLKGKGTKHFLKVCYELYPPKSGASLPANLDDQASLEKAIKLTLLQYHPDKNDEYLHGMYWKVITTEICSLLNSVRNL